MARTAERGRKTTAFRNCHVKFLQNLFKDHIFCISPLRYLTHQERESIVKVDYSKNKKGHHNNERNTAEE